jgi:hypothetical protein
LVAVAVVEVLFFAETVHDSGCDVEGGLQL